MSLTTVISFLLAEISDIGFYAIGAGIAIFTGAGAGLGMGIAKSKAVEDTARQPEALGKIRTI